MYTILQLKYRRLLYVVVIRLNNKSILKSIRSTFYYLFKIYYKIIIIKIIRKHNMYEKRFSKTIERYTKNTFKKYFTKKLKLPTDT